MKYLPCKELTAILLPAYATCVGKAKKCPCGINLDPGNGYIPRGFGGGLGKLSDIELFSSLQNRAILLMMGHRVTIYP